MRFEINDVQLYLDNLDETLSAFDQLVPMFADHGIPKGFAFVGWVGLCLIDFLGNALSEGDEGEAWKL